jgi:hypothetical protein
MSRAEFPLADRDLWQNHFRFSISFPMTDNRPMRLQLSFGETLPIKGLAHDRD